MTFPETLRELARLRPEKFRFESEYSPKYQRWYIEFSSKNKPVSFQYYGKYEEDSTREPNDVVFTHTQDDIDSIAAELDRRITVGPGQVDEQDRTKLYAEIWTMDWLHIATIRTNETEKNPAMQKALTAVVEELKKGGIDVEGK